MSISGLHTNFLSTPNPRQVCPNTNNTTTATKWKLFHRSSNVVRVWARTKDVVEVKLTGLGSSRNAIGQFSAPVKPGKDDGTSKRQNYYLNLGYAIRSLREEFPEVFYKEPSFDIYRDDIVFKDPLNKFVGINNYKTIFQALRFHGRIFFKALWVDVLSVWQPTEGVIMIRWTVHGIPRVPWDSRGRFDGTSKYKLDEEGKIYQHKVDNVAFNSPPKFRVIGVEELMHSLGVSSSTPKPTCFEMSFSYTNFAMLLRDYLSSEPHK